MKKKVEEIKEMIYSHLIDNPNYGYKEKTKALNEIIDFCKGPK